MSMKDAALIIATQDFQTRLKVALTRTAIAVQNETANDVQTLTVTGTPTGGTVTVNSLPGSIVTTRTGTTTNASASITGLTTTTSLFVGMSVVGSGIPAGATIATIASATAITISANATASATVSLTFSGTAPVVIPFNATAASVQAMMQSLSNIGVNNVLCTGGPLPGTPIVVNFINNLGGTPQTLMTVAANNLTGGSSPTMTITKTTNGVSANLHTARAALAKNVLANMDDWAKNMGLGVTDNATIQTDYPPNATPPYSLNVSENTVDNDLAFQVAAIWNAYI